MLGTSLQSEVVGQLASRIQQQPSPSPLLRGAPSQPAAVAEMSGGLVALLLSAATLVAHRVRDDAADALRRRLRAPLLRLRPRDGGRELHLEPAASVTLAVLDAARYAECYGALPVTAQHRAQARASGPSRSPIPAHKS